MKIFRDWDKVESMGDGIDGFRRMLSMYGSTISIALTDANLYVSDTPTATTALKELKIWPGVKLPWNCIKTLPRQPRLISKSIWKTLTKGLRVYHNQSWSPSNTHIRHEINSG